MELALILYDAVLTALQPLVHAHLLVGPRSEVQMDAVQKTCQESCFSHTAYERSRPKARS